MPTASSCSLARSGMTGPISLSRMKVTTKA